MKMAYQAITYVTNAITYVTFDFFCNDCALKLFYFEPLFVHLLHAYEVVKHIFFKIFFCKLKAIELKRPL